MSVNFNRAKFNKAHTSKEYKILLMDSFYPLYWEEGYSYHYKSLTTWSKTPNKRLLKYEVRKFKSWKHNRKKQYKE